MTQSLHDTVSCSNQQARSPYQKIRLFSYPVPVQTIILKMFLNLINSRTSSRTSAAFATQPFTLKTWPTRSSIKLAINDSIVARASIADSRSVFTRSAKNTFWRSFVCSASGSATFVYLNTGPQWRPINDENYRLELKSTSTRWPNTC